MAQIAGVELPIASEHGERYSSGLSSLPLQSDCTSFSDSQHHIDMVKSVLSHLCGSTPHDTRCLPNFPSEVTILLENTLHVPQLNTTFC